MDCEYDESFTKEQIDEARQKAREMMDGNKWHEALDDILNSYMDIDKFKEADDLLSELDMSTNDTTFNTGIGWHGSNLRPDFIPSMEDIYGLWSKIIKIQDKITNWFEETYQRIDNNCEHNIKMRNLILSQGNPSNSAIPQETGE